MEYHPGTTPGNTKLVPVLDKAACDRLLDSQRGYFSSSYVYWHISSDDNQGREGQLLWVGSNRARAFKDWGTYTYDEVKFIATRGRWADIPGYAQCQDPRDYHHLAEAIREWLAEVKDCFPDPAATS